MPEFGGKTARILVICLVIICGGFAWGFSKKTPKKLPVCELQGSGETSPYSGSKVILQGIVSVDLEGQIPAGFFIIDQNCPDDEKGSRGVFIQHGGDGDIVHLGDKVQIKGLVQEIVGETRILSDPAEIEILSLGNEIPSGINLAGEFLLDPVSFQYEHWEGMLVSFPKSEFLAAFMKTDLPRVMPLFDLDPALQMICLQGQSITLQLTTSENIPGLKDLASGDLIYDLSGVMRQNTNGYLLELITGDDYSVVGRNSLFILPAEESPTALIQSGTEGTTTPGAMSGTLSATPTSTPNSTVTTNPLPTWYPVHLLISEFFPNPSGKEPDGEWIEIYNPEQYGQPLTGIKIGDETSPDGKEGMLRFPDGYYIEGKEVLVIAQRAEAFFSENGFLPDFEMEGSVSRIPDLLPYDGWGRSRVQLSNSGDEVLLLDPWDGIVDLVVYGNSTEGGFSAPPPAPNEGHSLERYPPERDRDKGGDWREREQASPGRLDRSPPTQSASLTPGATETIIASLQPSPTRTSTYLSSLSPTIEASDTLTPSLTFTPTMSQTPFITATQTPTPMPGISWTPTLIPTTSVPVITATVLEPSATSSATWTAAPSTPSWTPQPSLTPSMTGSPDPSDTPTGTSTLLPAVTITLSQEPTITETLVYLEDLDIVLNEVHADPDQIMGDANKDGSVHSDNDEFLEFVNIKDGALDLSGWSVSDALRIRYIFPAGSILERGCAVVIFGGGVPGGDFGGSQIYTAGSLGLNNPGDTITLRDGDGVERLRYQYGAEGSENQSLTRSPDISGDLPLVLHSELPETLGALFSPGVQLDGSVFSECP